ncbi:uncharacterized protein BDW43DRAFT_285786 [Aspergillus alliaceus]|uniref:uncharacterized protein n=1 Tax=Petromyces alliaceus TaxID=209559 RepID=UPI0012A75562|nr:uncharacterized protein BDW43DRAFT_285786 [Aspergillus alliaceus]KAB8230352.1 hypothetical protein BDW43DRAFT_285786 [Aspergillus alliaceus]
MTVQCSRPRIEAGMHRRVNIPGPRSLWNRATNFGPVPVWLFFPSLLRQIALLFDFYLSNFLGISLVFAFSSC